MKRVVITGMGCVTPYGIGAENLWGNVANGNSAIKKFNSNFNAEGQLVKIGGQIPELNLEEYVSAKELKRMDKFVLYALIAAEDAYRNSKLNLAEENPYKIGVIMGTSVGGLATITKTYELMLQKGFTKCSPFTVPMVIPNMAASKVSIKYKLKGLCKAVSTACATGAHAIGDAYRSIQCGDVDIMFAGGCDTEICNFGMGGFTSARTLSKNNEHPQQASRPFDKDRDGFVISEGGAVLILEEREHALKRNATIYAEIVGYGQSADAYDAVAPDPNGDGASYAIKSALENAAISTNDINYINMHGTSTKVGDVAESKLVERIFGNKNANKNLLVSSTKSMTGHLLGAAGAAEAIISILAARDSIAPPTINLDNQDDEVANLDYVPNIAKKHNIKYALSNSFGFGGCNAVLIFKKSN